MKNEIKCTRNGIKNRTTKLLKLHVASEVIRKTVVTESPLLESESMLTGVHDDVGHLWRHLGDHNGTNALGELFHCNLGMKKDI